MAILVDARDCTEPDLTAVGIVEAGNQMQEGAVSAPGLAHQGHAGPGFKRQVDSLEHRQQPLRCARALPEIEDLKQGHGRFCRI
ncbi:hypothetical protein BB934_37190 (plasmid) [Microvirga ossetica]|uniref:Uncharacterized protein n=1 Tax=Microvirga ossetica TaxID=1882682 RepID=A0A1B2EV52_9HYPH|nr:hypothetical protein BB934_37190 [Microvirga ossetica]